MIKLHDLDALGTYEDKSGNNYCIRIQHVRKKESHISNISILITELCRRDGVPTDEKKDIEQDPSAWIDIQNIKF